MKYLFCLLFSIFLVFSTFGQLNVIGLNAGLLHYGSEVNPSVGVNICVRNFEIAFQYAEFNPKKEMNMESTYNILGGYNIPITIGEPSLYIAPLFGVCLSDGEDIHKVKRDFTGGILISYTVKQLRISTQITDNSFMIGVATKLHSEGTVKRSVRHGYK